MSENDRRNRSAAHYAHLQPTDSLRAVVHLAATLMRAPVAMINVVDTQSQYTIVAHGAHLDTFRVPASESMCATVVDKGDAVVVLDVTDEHSDGVIVELLRSKGFRSYIGMPILGREGLPVGTLCILDSETRPGGDTDLDILEQCAVLAKQALEVARSARQSGEDLNDTDHAVAIGSVVDAVDLGAIRPWYMPIVDLATNRIYAFEALARWVHPTGQMTYPDAFLPLIENTDYIIDFDLAMLRHALTDLRSWHATQSGANAAAITVNFSAHHFYRRGCVDRIEAVTRDAGASPSSVVLELTETATVPTRALIEANVIDELRDRGYNVILDDLGGDWLPAKHLLNFAFDGYKADRSIGASLDTSVGRSLALAIAELSKRLGTFLVIEGIETAAQADLARELGATYGQGFFWSPAMPASDVPTWSSRHLTTSIT